MSYQVKAVLIMLSALFVPICAQGAITFEVNSDAKPSARLLLPNKKEEVLYRASRSMLHAAASESRRYYDGLDIRSCSGNLKDRPDLVGTSKSVGHFASTVMLAYNERQPVIITPDAVWTTILQEVTRHISANSDKYGHLLVNPIGQLEVSRIVPQLPSDDKVTDSDDVILPEKEELLPDLANAASNNIKDEALREVVTAPFSTSSTDDQLAFGLTFGAMIQDDPGYWGYFYRGGIPEVTLGGTTEDWIALKKRADHFKEYGLDWWLKALQPTLAQFVAASQGEINKTFWQGMIKCHRSFSNGLASYKLHGWLVNFFPYLSRDMVMSVHPGHSSSCNDFFTTDTREPFKRNDHLLTGDLTDPETYHRPNGPDLDIPRIFSRVEIRVRAKGKDHEIQASSGVLDVQQNDLTLKPLVGWVLFDGRLASPKPK